MDAVVELSRPGDGPGEGLDFAAKDITVQAVARVFQVGFYLPSAFIILFYFTARTLFSLAETRIR